MMYPLVRELAAKDAPIRVPVTVTCRVLKLSRQPYYRWLKQPITNADRVEAYRANALFDAHQDDAEFGHRLLADEARDAGESMADRTAWRICRDNGWWSAFGKKRSRNGKKAGPPVHDDLCAVVDETGRIRHEFTADGPNRLWLTDITEHRTGEGKLYLCAVKDVFANKIVGYSIDSRMKSSLAVRALENAVQMRGDVAGCVIHSDRGSQFRSRKFLRAISRHRMVGSESPRRVRRAYCWCQPACSRGSVRAYSSCSSSIGVRSSIELWMRSVLNHCTQSAVAAST